MEDTLTCQQVADQYPDHEIVRVRYLIPTPTFPQGFECALMIPRDKIAASPSPPWFRHGQTMTINPGPPYRTKGNGPT